MAEKIYGNRWKTVKTIGEGGQGQVFLVADVTSENDKNYVLKRLKNSNRLPRFANEVETIRKLDHPNIVKIIDANLENDKPYFVTEYCEGGELTFVKVSRLSAIERLKLFFTICRAIGYAHENHKVHRDIKPPNILLKADEITPIITDFGICFNTDEGLERITETIEQAGSRFYMPPELADGRAEDVTPSSDVYSLGKLLYWMFSGNIFDREQSNGVQKYLLPKWDLQNKTDFENHILFIYDIFNKTILENPNERIQNGYLLADEIRGVVSIMENNGRYLDANIPNLCVFCGVGKYSKKEIVPTITKIPVSGGQPINYSLNYSRLALINKSIPDWEIALPQPNIDTDAYLRFLILTCDYCGNIQTFNTQDTNWKNVKPKIN